MKQLNSSFRDPSGFVFEHNGIIYRQVNMVAKTTYDKLMDSGLFTDLQRKGWIISHSEVDLSLAVKDKEDAYRIIRPEIIPFISYPYEWSFGQMRDAALLVLKIQLLALKYGMVLKDASAFNIQFLNGKPLLIDTLSFDIYKEGSTWSGYRQYCQHFLAPLLLMSKKDIRFGQLSKLHIDGIPLDFASSLLPRLTWLMPNILFHIHLHARAQRKFSNEGEVSSKKHKPISLSRNGFVGIIASLQGLIEKLDWHPVGTEWGDYYNQTNYSDKAFIEKLKTIEEILNEISPSRVWDLGANTGVFSRLASKKGIPTVAFDIDPAAVELNYKSVKKDKESHLLPLIMDLTNPSSGIGWSCSERDSFLDRGPVDCVLALALVHHLAISNNLPFFKIVDFFSTICNDLVIEFVPKADSQVKRLLWSRLDVFENYNQEDFEKAFSEKFIINKKAPVSGSERIIYWMTKRL